MNAIVKVQRALFPPSGPALVYDQPRRIFRDFELGDLPDAVREALKKEPKVYWSVVIRNGDILFLSRVKAQSW